MTTRITLALVLTLALAGSSHGLVTNLVANLDGAQANAGVGTGSLGTGTGTMTYDDSTGILTWNVAWAGMSGAATLMHFHGPAPAGVNAGVTVNIGGISGLISPSIGQAVISAAQATELLDELWYINIHTSLWPGGEIRGQVLVEGTIANEDRSWSSIRALYR